MITNTKVLFSAILKRVKADCVCDIGSRDGDQARLFRHLCPEAKVMAFEANPINFKAMAANPTLRSEEIEVLPFAVSGARGTAKFHVIDVDYSDPEANKGISSLLTRDDLPVKTTIEVETRRIDEVVQAQCAQAATIGLWIDVEGAEYGVLEGMSGIKDRVVAVHVETAKVPQRHGQRTLQELKVLMDGFGFALCGSNIRRTAEWGDVVFVSRHIMESLGFRFLLCKLRGYLGVWVPVDHAAVFLKSHFPAVYRLTRRIYLRVGT